MEYQVKMYVNNIERNFSLLDAHMLSIMPAANRELFTKEYEEFSKAIDKVLNFN